jgi:NDP-sugar pyrophosphorylase family protein
MHGLILAGGEGSRLAASGVATPKALVPIRGVPQLVRLARILEGVGCTTLTCLIREGVALDPIAAELARLSVPLRVHSCRTPSSLHTLVQGLAVTPPGAVFCTMVDTVMPVSDWARAYSGASHALAAGAEAVLVVTSFVDDERPLFVAQDAAGRVTAIGDAPRDPVLVTGGVYAFSPRARAAAPATLAAGRARMRALLCALLERGYDVRSVEIAKIIDLDDRHDLELANTWQESCENGGTPMG